VKSIWPQCTNAQPEVDLRERWNRNGHELNDLITNTRVARAPSPADSPLDVGCRRCCNSENPLRRNSSPVNRVPLRLGLCPLQLRRPRRYSYSHP
jgi:hypothetical protein